MKNLKVIFILLIFILIMNSLTFASTFSDVNNKHWAYETIENMVSTKIIFGYPDGTFKPDQAITRAEATKLFMLSLSESDVFPYGIYVFDDVSTNYWANKYIINGKLYILPYDNFTFKSEQKITRLEFANAIAKRLETIDINNNLKVNDINLSDTNNLSEKEIEGIKKLIKLGIINGYEDGTFRPENTLTRAEVCKILSKAMEYRTEKLETEISNTEGCYQVDPETNWMSVVKFDEEGCIKQYTGMKETMLLYYNGKYVMEERKGVDTLYIEKIVTDDGKEWIFKWCGENIVELKGKNNPNWKIIDYYTGREMEFDKYFQSETETLNILKYFSDSEYEIDKTTNENRIGFVKKNNYNSIRDAYQDNNAWYIGLESIYNEILSEEINDTTNKSNNTSTETKITDAFVGV